tara:strand:+ start:94 stop:405 length:312 start_codon:yes stop_codon:yes gene_type:complete
MFVVNAHYTKTYSCIPVVNRDVNVFLKDDKINTITFKRKHILAILWFMSFIPYFLPHNLQPQIYHDGLNAEQIKEKQHKKELNGFLGGKYDESIFTNITTSYE